MTPTFPMMKVLGATSLAIGLALQGTLSNLAAGVMLLIFRPFHVGHDVEVGGKAGKVKSLSLFMTELIGADNTQILLPNGAVWGQPIIKNQRLSRDRRAQHVLSGPRRRFGRCDPRADSQGPAQ